MRDIIEKILIYITFRAVFLPDNFLYEINIEEKATPEVKEKLKNNEITVNKAYQDIKKEGRVVFRCR